MKFLLDRQTVNIRDRASLINGIVSPTPVNFGDDITGIDLITDEDDEITLWWKVQVKDSATSNTVREGYIRKQFLVEDSVSEKISTDVGITSYLDDGEVELSRGSIDLVGAKKFKKSANVPSDYVVQLQKDLTTLGFNPGAIDGYFGHNTDDALKAFQHAALNTSRKDKSGNTIAVTVTYLGDAHGECDDETREEIQLWLDKEYRGQTTIVAVPGVVPPPKKVNNIPFAPANPSAHWPIQKTGGRSREIAYEATDGKIYGSRGRRFLADRANGRYHVGVDLWADAGDIVVACEDGRIVNHYLFYNGVHALFEQCASGVVINYGEVKPNSWREFGVDIGSMVRAGQPIARVGQMKHSAMCHFEMYTNGTTKNHRYFKKNSPPANLLNPTKYLLALAGKITAQGAASPSLPDGPLNPAPDFSGMELLKLHNAFPSGVRWQLVPQGIDIEGSGIERTAGSPKTVTEIWNKYNVEINRWATVFNVPCVLIVAIIAVESRGDDDALRIEKGYRSDSETPHKVSPGLMQTLISTARSALKGRVASATINRAWLFNPDNSIQAGTAYIAEQRSKTLFDPPKVACAYNAGGVYENKGKNNRWKMRQFPIGTSAHCDRFVQWFNDAVIVLESHPIRPSVPYDVYFS